MTAFSDETGRGVKLTRAQFIMQMILDYARVYPGAKAKQAMPAAAKIYRDFTESEGIEFGDERYAWDANAAAVLVAEYEDVALEAALSASPVGEPLRRIVLDTLNAVAPAVENLSVHQEQCDRDGVMVKVSRQALDEVLNAVNEVAMQSAITTSPASPVAQEPVAQMTFFRAMGLAERGFENWKAKEHNAKWFKRIDGTPIPNDLLVNIAEAFCNDET